MGGLVNYGSSDEEEDLDNHAKDTGKGVAGEVDPAPDFPNGSTRLSETQLDASSTNQGLTPRKTSNEDELNPDTDLVGPVQGPTIPSGEPDMGELLDEGQDAAAAPQSPYSENRALIRELTLPSLPNYNIPTSPPGSPIASTNAKFKHFLELKKKGVHFNEKLAKSSALKNPGLMQKLMDFAGIEEAGQYSTTLSKDIWDPAGFPEHAYKEELAKGQKKFVKKLEEDKLRGQREAVEFVPSSIQSDSSSRNGTPLGAKPVQNSAAERIMAGLDSGRSKSPQVIQGTKRKSRFDS
ncbi:HCNGP-like protein-domain-containing protein [Amylocarpus encephaloides]|uniref:HCNGP-like protein-domain-containing protein n=1 Tax=Amylocarpus encephaloides TaxID=45428 RepID=A0A9P8C7K2_9HELO|nr:HCNGP-like protein-domain-containing protein [Amylocarpus encephaloides]